MFTLNCLTDVGTPVQLLYDPHTSELLNPNGSSVISDSRTKIFTQVDRISPSNPGRKSSAPRTLKIQLGLNCNYSCSYCSQRSEISSATTSKTADAVQFLSDLNQWLTEEPEQIEYWGGEPLLYFSKLKKLVPELKTRFPLASHLIVTNGSLIDLEIVEFIEKFDIQIAISHDGPAQSARGPDPFEDPKKAYWIRELWRRRGPLKRMSFNMVFTPQNRDIKKNLAWFAERVGDADVAMSTEGVVSVYDSEALAGSGNWTERDHEDFRRSMVEAFSNGTALRFGTILDKARDFVDSLHEKRPSSALGQKCGMDREDELAVDLKGNVMTCQNAGAQGKHGIGSVFDLANVQLNTSLHWSWRESCNYCPVLQLCKGSCMYLEGDLFAQSCEHEFQYNSAILAGILKRITGLNLKSISGDIRRPKQKPRIIPLFVER